MTVTTERRPRLQDVSEEWRRHLARAEELRAARAVLDGRLRGLREELKATRETPPGPDDLAAAVLADGADAAPAEHAELRARFDSLQAKRETLNAELERHMRAGQAVRTRAAPDLLAAVSAEREPLLADLTDTLERLLGIVDGLQQVEGWLDKELDSRGGWAGFKTGWLPLAELRTALQELHG